ncbi:DUF1905 domain-containing protein [Bailinhaonella thermotolerans]|uniref:DUF1905 domain-containing protein n=2 Tax=Bailinhaonella thermotolerans TaxID=1070861 RepID=A0A3A4AZA6_9ACTN|nr:DUF1905 domain-containing protein [Bailinhaonella thermotolerans]
MKFRTVVELGGKTATGFEIPAEVVEGLGAGKRPAVTVTVNGGYTYRSTVAVMGGRFLVPLSAEHRTGAGVSAGDEVDLELDLDTAPREIAVPPDLAEALAGDQAARGYFEGLSYSQQRRFTEWIESAKKPETRERRVREALAMLQEGRPR